MLLDSLNIRTNQEFILSVERESLTTTATSIAVNEIFSTWNLRHLNVTWLSPINVNVSAMGKLGLHCSAFKHLFCVFGDKATAYRADIYRFLGIPSCLDIEVDLLSSWSTEPTLRHATNFGYRIGDLGERILPRYGNPTSRNRKESHRFWRRDGRAVIDGLPNPPVISGFTRCIRRYLLYGLYARMNLLSETN